MRLQVWHLSGNGFHFGRHGLGQEQTGTHVPSDSLFAALIARLAELRGNAAVEQFVAGFLNDSPPFVLTSAFLRAGPVLFFPPPMRLSPSAVMPEGVRPKDLKKIKFVSENIFRQIIAGRCLVEFVMDGKTLHDKTVLLTGDEYASLPKPVIDSDVIYNVERRPRVALGRAIQDSQIYFDRIKKCPDGH